MRRVSEVMTRGVRTMTPNETVTQAAQAMAELDVGVIPVCEGTQLVGLVTDRDLVVRCLSRDLPPHGTSLREVMSRNLCWCFEDDALDDVIEQMRAAQIRRVPVFDRSKQVVGIVSLGDIAVKEDEIAAGRALEEISEPARPAGRGDARPRPA